MMKYVQLCFVGLRIDVWRFPMVDELHPVSEIHALSDGDAPEVLLAAAISQLKSVLRLLDALNETRAAIYVSHALALVDGTGGAVPDEEMR